MRHNLIECSSGVTKYFGILVAQILVGAARLYTLEFVASLYCHDSKSLEKVSPDSETEEMDQCALSIESIVVAENSEVNVHQTLEASKQQNCCRVSIL